MKRVLVLTTTYPTFLPGDGTPPFVHELTKRMHTPGLEMVVLAPRRPGTRRYEQQDGVKIYRYPYFFFSTREKLADGAILPNIKKNKWLIVQVPFLFCSCLFFTVQLVWRLQIGTIHAHRIVINGFVGALVKKIMKKRTLICTSHGSDLHTLHGGVLNTIKRWTIRQGDEVTVVSSYLKDQLDLLMGTPRPAQIISMGVDEKKFHSKKYDETIKQQYNMTGLFLLFVGRLAPEKGVAYLIDAMPKVVKKYPDCTLLIIGDGPLKELLRKQVTTLGIEKHIVFVGSVPNDELPAYYATADICILPSVIESFGLVAVESIMSGTPVVASNSLGIKDIIIHKEHGYICESRDAVSICDGIQWCLDNNIKGIGTINNFSWTVVSSKYSNLLEICDE